jgi:hypothetical protein
MITRKLLVALLATLQSWAAMANQYDFIRPDEDPRHRPERPPRHDEYRPDRPVRPEEPPHYYEPPRRRPEPPRHGERPPYPVRPEEPPRYHPAPPYYDGYMYGPAYTQQWIHLGSIKAPKVASVGQTFHLNDHYVNELWLRVDRNSVQVTHAWLELINGQRVDLGFLRGFYYGGQNYRFVIDGRYSLRARRLYIEITSPNLIGSLGRLEVNMGIYR